MLPRRDLEPGVPPTFHQLRRLSAAAAQPHCTAATATSSMGRTESGTQEAPARAPFAPPPLYPRHHLSGLRLPTPRGGWAINATAPSTRLAISFTRAADRRHRELGFPPSAAIPSTPPAPIARAVRLSLYPDPGARREADLGMGAVQGSEMEGSRNKRKRVNCAPLGRPLLRLYRPHISAQLAS
ncbi:hypothetical protein ABZP36_020984 [Zizania latifolia]